MKFRRRLFEIIEPAKDGDIMPLSVGGKIVGMVSALFGVGVIALPTAVLTAGFMHELQLRKRA